MEQEFLAIFTDALAETGTDLQADAATVATYANERAAHLATLIGQPGFEMAVRAERDSVAIRAALAAHDSARASDQRLVGIIQASLAFGAKLISGGLI